MEEPGGKPEHIAVFVQTSHSVPELGLRAGQQHRFDVSPRQDVERLENGLSVRCQLYRDHVTETLIPWHTITYMHTVMSGNPIP